MGELHPARAGGITPSTRPDRLGSVLVSVWVIALIALIAIGVTTSSGPLIATSLIIMATAPIALLLVIAYSAIKGNR